MSSPAKSPKKSSGTKKHSPHKKSPAKSPNKSHKRMLGLLGQNPIASIVSNYLNKPADNVAKLVKRSAPNGNLSRAEILKREHNLQKLAMFTKSIQNAKKVYNRKQTHKQQSIRRLLRNADLLVGDILQYDRPIDRVRLLSRLAELQRLRVNESRLEQYRNI